MTRTMLHTKRLSVRRATPADMDTMRALWRDGELRQRNPRTEHSERLDAEPRHLTMPERLLHEDSGLHLWLLVPRGQHVAVGCVGLPNRQAARRSRTHTGGAAEPCGVGQLETLVVLHTAFRDHGYDREALAALMTDSVGSAHPPPTHCPCGPCDGQLLQAA